MPSFNGSWKETTEGCKEKEEIRHLSTKKKKKEAEVKNLERVVKKAGNKPYGAFRMRPRKQIEKEHKERDQLFSILLGNMRQEGKRS